MLSTQLHFAALIAALALQIEQHPQQQLHTAVPFAHQILAHIGLVFQLDQQQLEQTSRAQFESHRAHANPNAH